MAEKIHHSPEQHHHTPEALRHNQERSHHETAHRHKENIEHIRREAQEQAQSTHEVVVDKAATEHKPKEHFVNSELKDLAYQRTMTRIRKQLSPVSRTFSKVIHQPAIDAMSEGVAKTVGRPSGFLGGGLLALAGTTAYYYIARHYGYEYNFGVFVVLIATGFVLGWLIEAVWRVLSPKR